MIRVIGKTKMPLTVQGKVINYGKTVYYDSLTPANIEHVNSLERLDLISYEYVNNVTETVNEPAVVKTKRKSKLVE